jgi:E3 ubiquitin-protein ligase SspH2
MKQFKINNKFVSNYKDKFETLNYEDFRNQNVVSYRIKDCILTKCEELDLSSLGIKWLPKIPTHIKILNCSRNRLTSLPRLPRGLQELTCNNNLLTQLPTLPPNLRVVHYKNNPIKNTPLFTNDNW